MAQIETELQLLKVEVAYMWTPRKFPIGKPARLSIRELR